MNWDWGAFDEPILNCPLNPGVVWFLNFGMILAMYMIVGIVLESRFF